MTNIRNGTPLALKLRKRLCLAKGAREMRKEKLLRTILLAVILLMGATPGIHAQESATISATATVLPSMSVTGDNDLIFGTVLPDVDKSVDKATSGFAGAFHIQGNNGSEVTVDFVLPTDLHTSDSSSTMTIVFTDTDASYDDETGGGQSSPAGVIDPRGLTTLNLGASGAMDIWLGGTVRPSITQTGGNYAADVTLTVTYTGN